MTTFLRCFAFLLAFLLPPVAAGAAGVIRTMAAMHTTPDAAPPRPANAGAAHDPDKPTAVVVLGANGAQVTDVLAPYEVLATTGAFNLYTVAPEPVPVPLTGGLDLVPDLTFAELDRRLDGAADLVVVPALPDVGEPSTAPVTAWLRRQAARGGGLLLSVCNGGQVLASAGLLDGRDATSHWTRIATLEDRYPQVRWVRGTRYVEDGDVMTTGGVLSGVDGSLRAVERLVGTEAARDTATAIAWPYHSPGTRRCRRRASPPPTPSWRSTPTAGTRPPSACC
jgi:transcriptional regulator GlxA family with amidase domain